MTSFRNEYLEINKVSKTKFEYEFLGDKGSLTTSESNLDKSLKEFKDKRTRAFELVPDGCRVIPKSMAPMLVGLLIGGVLEDSVYIVYGLAEKMGGIRGFSCSLYFLPDGAALDKLIDYSSLHGEFCVKGAPMPLHKPPRDTHVLFDHTIEIDKINDSKRSKLLQLMVNAGLDMWSEDGVEIDLFFDEHDTYPYLVHEDEQWVLGKSHDSGYSGAILTDLESFMTMISDYGRNK